MCSSIRDTAGDLWNRCLSKSWQPTTGCQGMNNCVWHLFGGNTCCTHQMYGDTLEKDMTHFKFNSCNFYLWTKIRSSQASSWKSFLRKNVWWHINTQLLLWVQLLHLTVSDLKGKSSYLVVELIRINWHSWVIIPSLQTWVTTLSHPWFWEEISLILYNFTATEESWPSL